MQSADAWPTVAHCLTGVDLIHLTRSSKWIWRWLSQDAFWRDRLTPEDPRDPKGTTALHLYLRVYSFQFHGLPVDDQAPIPCGSCAELSRSDISAIQQYSPFAFDVYFALLDGSGGNGGDNNDEEENTATYAGGILFGAQDVCYNNVQWSLDHQ